MRAIRIATRTSALARAQAHAIGGAIAAATGRDIEYVAVTTRGDLDTGPLSMIGGAGVFVTAVRGAVLRGDADLAIHSAKDLPTAPCAGLTLLAVPLRESPRDALCAPRGVSLAALPAGSRVGTSAPRRAAAIAHRRPDLHVVDIRGNVDSRLAKLAAGQVDALVLAVAGLHRLDRGDAISEVLAFDVLLPAPGQGALAVEARVDDASDFEDVSAALEHAPTRAALIAEQAVLAGLGLGCSAAVGAWADVEGDRIDLVAEAYAHGRHRASLSGPRSEAEALGRSIALQLSTHVGPTLERVP